MKGFIALICLGCALHVLADGDYKHMKASKKPIVKSTTQSVITLRRDELRSYKASVQPISFYKSSKKSGANEMVTSTAKKRGYKHQF